MLVQAQKATALAKAAVRNAVSNVPHAAMRSAPRGASRQRSRLSAWQTCGIWRLASTAATALFIAIIATRGDVGSDRVSGALASLHLASPPAHGAPAPMQLASQTARQAVGASSDIDAHDAAAAGVRALTRRPRPVGGSVACSSAMSTTSRDRSTARSRKTNGASEQRPGKPSRAGGRTNRPNEGGQGPLGTRQARRSPLPRDGSGADDAEPCCRRQPVAPPRPATFAHAGLAAHARPAGAAARYRRLWRRHRRRPLGIRRCAPVGRRFAPPIRSCSRAGAGRGGEEVPKPNRVELRLVAGPLPEAGAAQLCASLGRFACSAGRRNMAATASRCAEFRPPLVVARGAWTNSCRVRPCWKRLMRRPLFLPTARQTNWLLIVGFLALGEAIYLRYMAIENVRLARLPGRARTWLCSTFRLSIVLYEHQVFGAVALAPPCSI